MCTPAFDSWHGMRTMRTGDMEPVAADLSPCKAFGSPREAGEIGETVWDVISRHRGRMCTPVQLALNTESLSEEKTPHIRQEIVDNLSAGMSPIPGGPTREESIMGLEICMGELERRAAGRLCVPDPELLAMSKDHGKALQDGEGEELELDAAAQLEAAKGRHAQGAQAGDARDQNRESRAAQPRQLRPPHAMKREEKTKWFSVGGWGFEVRTEGDLGSPC